MRIPAEREHGNAQCREAEFWPRSAWVPLAFGQIFSARSFAQ